MYVVKKTSRFDLDIYPYVNILNVVHQRAAHTTELRTFFPIYNPENLNI